MGIKENWLKEDEKCAHCGAVTKKVRGITRQNIKRLFSFKIDMTEVIITILILMLLLMAVVYKMETKQCKDWLEPMKASYENCLFVSNQNCFNLHKVEDTYYMNFNSTIDLIKWNK